MSFLYFILLFYPGSENNVIVLLSFCIGMEYNITSQNSMGKVTAFLTVDFERQER